MTPRSLPPKRPASRPPSTHVALSSVDAGSDAPSWVRDRAERMGRVNAKSTVGSSHPLDVMVVMAGKAVFLSRAVFNRNTE